MKLLGFLLMNSGIMYTERTAIKASLIRLNKEEYTIKATVRKYKIEIKRK